MSFLGVPPYMAEPLEWCRRIARTVNDILNGKTNNIGSVTLTANAASTTVTEAAGRIGEDTVILFTAKTANAAAVIASIYYSKDVDNSQFTITHTNNANADKTFDYVLIG